jgi:hypothetical protein
VLPIPHVLGKVTGLPPWGAADAEVHHAHQRKLGLMPTFEWLVSRQRPRQEPSFSERARNRRLPQG